MIAIILIFLFLNLMYINDIEHDFSFNKLFLLGLCAYLLYDMFIIIYTVTGYSVIGQILFL
jgi:cell division protein FtsW (lipid II flippase)